MRIKKEAYKRMKLYGVIGIIVIISAIIIFLFLNNLPQEPKDSVVITQTINQTNVNGTSTGISTDPGFFSGDIFGLPIWFWFAVVIFIILKPWRIFS